MVIEALKIFKKLNLDPAKVGEFIAKAKLSRQKFNAGTPDIRRKILKTALRTILPFPLALAAGEILVQLTKAIPQIKDAVKNGI